MNLTDEQLAIQAAVAAGDNTMVSALAGTGKTTTVGASFPKGRRSIYLAFNAKVKKEATERFAPLIEARTLEVKTMNGLGHSAIGKALHRNCEVDASKLYKLCKTLQLSRPDQEDVQELVRKARLAGIIPKGQAGKGLLPDEDHVWEGIALSEDIDPLLTIPARQILRQSYTAALKGLLDFDDQIYISALVFGNFPSFDTIFVDEAQDLSALNHAQLRKMGNRAQLVPVGDPNQAIYAFRGADSDSMENMKCLRPSWTDLRLTLTYRCPSSIVERLSSHAPGFRAAPTNPTGTISHLSSWFPQVSSSTAIICRNNAPLLRLAFALTSMLIPVNLQGRDMGKTLKRLYKKVSRTKSPIEACDDHAAMDPGKADQWECLKILLQSAPGKDIDSVLADFAKPKDGAPTLLTGHKAKGLEWENVYHLDPQLIGKYASTEAEFRQEANLRYVIESRSMRNLFLVQSDQLEQPE